MLVRLVVDWVSRKYRLVSNHRVWWRRSQRLKITKRSACPIRAYSTVFRQLSALVWGLYIPSFVRLSVDSHLVRTRATDVSLVFCCHEIDFPPFLKRPPTDTSITSLQIALNGEMVCQASARDSQLMTFSKRVFVLPRSLTNILSTFYSPVWLWYLLDREAVVVLFVLISSCLALYQWVGAIRGDVPIGHLS